MELLTDHFFVPLSRKAVIHFSYLLTFPITYSSPFSFCALIIHENTQIILKKKKELLSSNNNIPLDCLYIIPKAGFKFLLWRWLWLK